MAYYVESKDGKIVHIDNSMRKVIEAQIACMSSRPLRCLLIAFKDVSGEDVAALLNRTIKFMDLESNLILVGVTGLVDPPRPDGKEKIHYNNETILVPLQGLMDAGSFEYSTQEFIRL